MTEATPTPSSTTPQRHGLRPPGTVRTLGRPVVIAPHPDDASLGCGGLRALLTDTLESPVWAWANLDRHRAGAGRELW